MSARATITRTLRHARAHESGPFACTAAAVLARDRWSSAGGRLASDTAAVLSRNSAASANKWRNSAVFCAMITYVIVTVSPLNPVDSGPKTGDSGHFGAPLGDSRARPPWVSLATPWVSLARVSLGTLGAFNNATTLGESGRGDTLGKFNNNNCPWVSLTIDTRRITRHISSTAEARCLAETRET